jgi:Leucine-rich repeat (LRR) protein
MKIKRLELIEQIKPNDKINKQVCKVKLNYKRIKKIPEQIFSFNNLQILELYYNNLTQIPAEIKLLTRLKELKLSNNYITQIPDELYSLTKLEKIILNHNPIKNISSKIKNMSGLKYIYMGVTDIQTFPDELFELPNIEKIGYHQSIFSDTYIYIRTEYYLHNLILPPTIKYIYNDFRCSSCHYNDIIKFYNNLPNNLEILFSFGHLQEFNNLPVCLKKIVLNNYEFEINGSPDIKLPFDTKLVLTNSD